MPTSNASPVASRDYYGSRPIQKRGYAVKLENQHMKYTKLTYRDADDYARTKVGLNRAVSNVVGAGGFPKSQHPAIHRAIRDRGWACFIAQQWAEDGYRCFCGVGDPSDIAAILSDGWKVTVGYTHDHAAHKLGGSNARAGWALYVRGY